MRPSAGARLRGSLSPDCPPARPCLVDDRLDGGEEAAEGGAEEEESLGQGFIQSSLEPEERAERGKMLSAQTLHTSMESIDNSSALVNAEIHSSLSGHVTRPRMRTAKKYTPLYEDAMSG